MQDYDKITDKELIRKLRDGDVSVTDYIMDKYKNLVRKEAKAMYLLGGDSDDLIQEGMIGLFKAIRDYNPEQEASFASFARLCISRQMNTAVKLSNRQKHIPLNSYVSLYDTGDSQEEEKQSPLIEQLQTAKDNNPEELFLDKEYVSSLEQELKGRLSDLEKKVLYLHLIGEDYQAIAKLLDKPPKSIDNALQRIKRKMSTILFDIPENV